MRPVRLRHPALLLVVLLFGFSQFASAQDETDIQTMPPVQARTLAGYVHVEGTTGLVLTRLKIEEWDPKDTRVLASTTTDRKGHFELKPMGRGKTHVLRVSAKGFHTREYEVELKKDAPEELDLEIQLVSTTEKKQKPKEIPR